MHRLTVEKNPVDMGYHLAHNCCYIKDHKARYRDFNIDVDCRDFARGLMLKYGLWDKDQDNKLLDDNLFDDVMIDNLQYDSSELTGLIALLYRNMWAMAELRETLKQYEDAEQQGDIVKLDIKIGQKVYVHASCDSVYTCMDMSTGTAECPFENDCNYIECKDDNERVFETTVTDIWCIKQGWYFNVDGLALDIPMEDIGIGVFLSKEEAAV